MRNVPMMAVCGLVVLTLAGMMAGQLFQAIVPAERLFPGVGGCASPLQSSLPSLPQSWPPPQDAATTPLHEALSQGLLTLKRDANRFSVAAPLRCIMESRTTAPLHVEIAAGTVLVFEELGEEFRQVVYRPTAVVLAPEERGCVDLDAFTLGTFMMPTTHVRIRRVEPAQGDLRRLVLSEKFADAPWANRYYAVQVVRKDQPRKGYPTVADKRVGGPVTPIGPLDPLDPAVRSYSLTTARVGELRDLFTSAGIPPECYAIFCEEAEAGRTADAALAAIHRRLSYSEPIVRFHAMDALLKWAAASRPQHGRLGVKDPRRRAVDDAVVASLRPHLGDSAEIPEGGRLGVTIRATAASREAGVPRTVGEAAAVALQLEGRMEDLLRAARDSNPVVRRHALMVLCDVPAKYEALLQPHLQDADPAVRAAALLAFGRMREATIRDPQDRRNAVFWNALTAGLEDADRCVRIAAVKILYRYMGLYNSPRAIFPPMVMPAARAFARDGTQEAARFLAEWGDARVIPHLEEGAKSSRAARDAAVATLRRIDTDEAHAAIGRVAALHKPAGGQRDD